MSGVCAFGLIAQEPDATHFRAGDVWRSPVGTRYKVIECTENTAILFAGGWRPVLYRGLDSITNALSGNPWVRESWGGKP